MSNKIDVTVRLGKSGESKIIDKLVSFGIPKKSIRSLPGTEHDNGDLEVKISGKFFYFEAKTTSGTSTLLNQIRASSCLPIIVNHRKRFYLISPENVLKIVSVKKRGQHSNDKFGSSHITCSKKNIENYFVDITKWSKLSLFKKWIDENYVPNDKRKIILEIFEQIDQETNSKKEDIMKEFKIF